MYIYWDTFSWGTIHIFYNSGLFKNYIKMFINVYDIMINLYNKYVSSVNIDVLKSTIISFIIWLWVRFNPEYIR